jgi:CHAT domain-containing protein
VFLQVSELRDGYLVTALSPTASWQYLVPESQADIRALAAQLRASLDPAASDKPFDRAAAAGLHSAIVSPELAAALGGAKRLKVSANGALGAIPFAILIPDESGADYLIDRLAITRLPGVPRGAGETTEPVAPSLVALGGVRGDPSGGEAVMRGGRLLDTNALPALPDAAGELADLARAIGAHDPLILTGEAATEEALRSARVSPGSVLAFATHGLVSGEVEGLREPALLLSASGSDDGLLTASEIARLDLPARWVLLSACNTAAGAGPDAPGLSGLAQAFIMAGAGEILATHWPVRDDLARLITTGTLREAAAGADPDEALRASILAARASGRPQASHPALWGAFELVE